MKNPFILLSWEKKSIPLFIEYLHEARHNAQFEYCTILLPHDRLRSPLESHIKYFLMQQSRASFLPQIHTIHTYIDILYARYVQDSQCIYTPLRHYEEILLLSNIISSHQEELHTLYSVFHKLTPSVQVSWLNTLIEIIHECLLENKNPYTLSTYTHNVHIEEMFTTFPILYSLYIQTLDEQCYTTPQYILYKTTQYFLENKDSLIHHFAKESLFLFGFPALNKTIDTLMHMLWEGSDVHICLYTNHSLYSSTQESECLLHKKWIEDWNAHIRYYPEQLGYEDTISSHSVYSKDSLQIYQYNTIHAQLHAMKSICDEYQDKKIGVIPLDSSLLEAILYYIDTERVNISIGFPFIHSALADLLERILQLQENRYTHLYSKEYLISLLRHQYILGYLQEYDTSLYSSIQYCIDSLQNKLDNYIDIQSIYEECCREYTTESYTHERLYFLFELFILSWDRLESYTHLTDIIQQLIDYIQQIPHSKLSTIEQASIACLSLRGIEYFKSNIPTTVFTKHTIPLTLRHYIQMERIPFKRVAEEKHSIDIIGLSEIQMLSFDIVIFLEACEGNVPHEKKENPFLPSHIQERMLGLPHAIEEVHREEYRFFSALYASDTAYIMYSTTDSKQIGGGKQRSRFIEKIIWNKEKQQKRSLEHLLLQQDTISYSLEPISYREIISNINLQEAIIQRLTRGISFSMISTYIQCPFKFIQEYIAEISFKDATHVKSDRQDIGTLIHNVFQLLFENYLHTTITRDDILSKEQEIISNIVERINTNSTLSIEQRIIAEYSIPKQINTFLLQQPECFYIEGVEKQLTATIQGFSLFGKADRIDIIEDTYHIVDYKTGAKRPQKTALHKVFHAIEDGFCYKEYLPYLRTAPIQMILYLYLLHQEYPKITQSNGVYYFLGERENNKVTYRLSEEGYTYEFVNDVFKKIITDIIESLCNIEDIECIRGTHCKYCQYQYLCM